MTLSNALAVLIAALTSIVALTGVVVKLVREVKELYAAVRKRAVIIGVVAPCDMPEALKPLPDFTDLKQGLLSGTPRFVYHVDRLSHALKVCDFVCFDTRLDPKIHEPSSEFWAAIAEG